MKTLCAFDNVACIVDNLALSLNGAYLPSAVVGLALIAAYILASVMKGN
jgi:hypothetical protein